MIQSQSAVGAFFNPVLELPSCEVVDAFKQEIERVKDAGGNREEQIRLLANRILSAMPQDADKLDRLASVIGYRLQHEGDNSDTARKVLAVLEGLVGLLDSTDTQECRAALTTLVEQVKLDAGTEFNRFDCNVYRGQTFDDLKLRVMLVMNGKRLGRMGSVSKSLAPQAKEIYIRCVNSGEIAPSRMTYAQAKEFFKGSERAIEVLSIYAGRDALCLTNAQLQDLVVSFPNLKKLVIRSHDVTDRGLECLQQLVQLQELTLNGCIKIYGSFGHFLQTLPALYTLNLDYCEHITDDGLEGLQRLAQLRSLSLKNCSKISDDGLAHLGHLAELRSLNLNKCDEITDVGMSHLKGLVKLQHLDLSYCKHITDSGLESLSGLAELQTLSLLACSEITGIGLATMADLKKLRNLDLSWFSGITDEGLACVKNFPELQFLNLKFSKVTDAGLAHMEGLLELEHLDLGFCTDISDAGLSSLQHCKKLQVLDLRDCSGLTGSGLAFLQQLVDLQRLYLYRCHSIDNANLVHLQNLKGLQLFL